MFGYLNEQDSEPTCMVSNVTKESVQELNQLHGFKVDDWFLSSGRWVKLKFWAVQDSGLKCKEAKAKIRCN
ncbi:hypothetical protein [uncultured Vibrio sp.]|uniref:hypothetical protein n=1 Tax=uncultured Vibrio sp. TaxID=114054 RepID=UPI0029C778B7|nr:hypothetical protein [uncultured Vibrio sp.]